MTPAILLILSPFIGSFLGVVIERLPAELPFLFGRSRCDACGHVLSARDLLPLLSWLALRGKCRHCGAAIGRFPLAVEVAALAVALWSVAALPGWLAIAGAGLGWTLLTLAWIDARMQLLPDALTLPLAAAGIAVAWALDPMFVPDHLVGAAIGFAAFALIAAVYRRLRGREGLGLGDAKLLGALGAWVGWQGLPTVVLYAAGAGLAWALATAMVRRSGQADSSPSSAAKSALDPARRLPFGPFLCLAGWLVWLHGPLTPG